MSVLSKNVRVVLFVEMRIEIFKEIVVSKITILCSIDVHWMKVLSEPLMISIE